MKLMTALVLENPGTQPVAVLKQIAVPQPGPSEVLVRVQAAALNHRDLYWLRGGMMGDHPAFTMGTAARTWSSAGRWTERSPST